MPANPQDDGFTETTEMPRSRRARAVPDIVMAKLAESAERNVAFTKLGTAAETEELKKTLTAATVRAKYEVVVETLKKDGKVIGVKFSATAKTPEPASA